MKVPQAQEGHKWLQRLVGEWSFSSPTQEGQPPHRGIERVKKLGDLWVVGESEMDMPDGKKGNAIITLGYDPETKRFVGSWVGDMMTKLWVYDGELDATGRFLSLYADGPTFDEKGEFLEGKTSKYRDQIEWVDENNRNFSGSVLGADGQWQRFMLTHYKRVG